MPTTFISTNIIGTGTQFTFLAAGDSLVVLPNATLGSTNGSAISNSFTDIEISVLGTLVSTNIVQLNSNSSFTLGVGGTYLSFLASSSNTALNLIASSHAQIDGTLSAPEAFAILTAGNNTVNVTGTVSGASGVFLGLFGSSGDILVNSGSIMANAHDDAARDTRYNNAVFTEGANTQITNLTGGTLTATSSEGNGVRVGAGGNGSIVTNHGTITSINAAGVDFSTAGIASTARLINTGVIQGATASFNGAGGGTFTILNSGHMIGNVVMGTGNDVFDGRGGRIDGSWTGGAGSDRYDGRGASLILGEVFGGLGNDTLLGGDGDETIYGEDNFDTLFGGNGDDQLFGGLDYDYLVGGNGNDGLDGGAGFDDMYGGAGDDTLLGGDGGMVGYGGGGDDYLGVDYSATADFGGAYGGAGDDTVHGGLIIDYIYGGTGDDTVYSNEGDDLVYGGAGDDSLDGSDGLDSLYGDAGNDTLVHAAGNGVLSGGHGLDTLTGGDGSDILDGGRDDDDLFGGIGFDTITGGTGDDQIYGGDNNDSIDGGAGDDLVIAGLGNDTVFGGAGDDALMGEVSNDVLNGGAGSDTIAGGQGRDSLTGGTGADHFLFLAITDSGTTAATRDTVSDFRVGEDRFDLSAADANSVVAGNQMFVFIGSGPFTNVAGQLQYSAVTGLLRGDVNGDGVADFAVEFQNLAALTATDLVL